MRSTKDLKDIVSDVRGRPKGSAANKGKMSGNYASAAHAIEEQLDEEYNFTKNGYMKQRSGGANFANKVDEDGDAAARLRKLQTLASSDKETIEVQQKKLAALRLELDEVSKKYGSLKRNFDSVSHYHKKDNADYTRVKNLAEQFEKEVFQLKEEKKLMENELSAAKVMKREDDLEIKQHKQTIEKLTAEVDQYKRELQRKEKNLESQLKTAQEGQRALYETQGKLNAENKRLREELVDWQKQNEELSRQIDQLGDAASVIKQLNSTLGQREGEIVILQQRLIEVAKDMNTETLMLQKMQGDNERLAAEIQKWRAAFAEEQVKVDELKPKLSTAEAKIKELLYELDQTKLNSGDSVMEVLKYKKKLKEAESELEQKQTKWGEKSREMEAQIERLELQYSDEKKRADQLQKQLNELGGASKGDAQQIVMLQKELYTLGQAKDQLSKEMDVLREKYNQMPTMLAALEAEKNYANQMKDQAMQDLEEAKKAAEVYQERSERAEKDLKKTRSQLDKSTDTQKAIQAVYDKMKTTFTPIEQTLSCLSCLEFLKEPNPLTLVCGHSICKKCFSQHSDPKSADSLVFCEECKIETKNKQLRDSLVMKTLCAKFSGQRSCLESMEKIFSKA